MQTIILGGGATSLALAYILRLSGCEVAVVESSPTLGGLLGTFEASPGVRLECYYHHFFTHDVELLWLLGELGLEDRVRFVKTTMGVLSKGRIFNFNGAGDLLKFKPLSLMQRLRFGASSLLLTCGRRYTNSEDETALGWFEKWAGAAATDTIWRPLMVSKFGRAAERIPLAWMAGRLRQRARSRAGADELLGYIDGSMQLLVDALKVKLEDCGVSITTSSPATSLISRDGVVAGVETASGPIFGDRVISCVPTPILAKLVKAIDPVYAAELETVEYIAAICTVLVTTERISPVYWLNVADDGFDFGGVIEQTNFLKPEHYAGRHVLYLSRYLEPSDPLWSMPDEELVQRQLAQLSKIMNRPIEPLMIASHVFRARYAAPMPDAGFSERIPKFKSPVANLFVAAMPHVYPEERSVNNCVRIAAEAAEAMNVDASCVPRGASVAGVYGHCSVDRPDAPASVALQPELCLDN